ncbi:hypothetical protein MJN51_39750, partial [Salmonella enterica subsp. enterica serovar Kentucky]|nr:hypothetical protein [Salmonella enterica subsp. enterica serovar Kentucky]
REDIPRLARHFLQVAARELGVEAKLLHPETETALTRLAWPGNAALRGGTRRSESGSTLFNSGLLLRFATETAACSECNTARLSH